MNSTDSCMNLPICPERHSGGIPRKVGRNQLGKTKQMEDNEGWWEFSMENYLNLLDSETHKCITYSKN